MAQYTKTTTGGVQSTTQSLEGTVIDEINVEETDIHASTIKVGKVILTGNNGDEMELFLGEDGELHKVLIPGVPVPVNSTDSFYVTLPSRVGQDRFQIVGSTSEAAIDANVTVTGGNVQNFTWRSGESGSTTPRRFQTVLSGSFFLDQGAASGSVDATMYLPGGASLSASFTVLP